MTPLESITAYESWCANNKSFKVQWKVNGVFQTLIFHMPQSIEATITQSLLSTDTPTSEGVPVAQIYKVASVPSWEGYKEWILNQE